MGFKRVSTKVLTVGTARWLIFRYGLDALAIGQCGSFHHLQRGFLWFKWGPPRRTMLLDHLPLVFPQRWDLLLKWKHRHHLQLRKQTMFAPYLVTKADTLPIFLGDKSPSSSNTRGFFSTYVYFWVVVLLKQHPAVGTIKKSSYSNWFHAKFTISTHINCFTKMLSINTFGFNLQ